MCVELRTLMLGPWWKAWHNADASVLFLRSDRWGQCFCAGSCRRPSRRSTRASPWRCRQPSKPSCWPAFNRRPCLTFAKRFATLQRNSLATLLVILSMIFYTKSWFEEICCMLAIFLHCSCTPADIENLILSWFGKLFKFSDPISWLGCILGLIITSVLSGHLTCRWRTLSQVLLSLISDDDGNNQWPELLKFLFDSVNSDNVGLREAALHIFWWEQVPCIQKHWLSDHLMFPFGGCL